MKMVKQVWMVWILLVVCCMHCSAAEQILEPQMVLTPPLNAVAGERAVVTALFTNGGETPVGLPRTLIFTLEDQKGRTTAVTALPVDEVNDASVMVPAKGFVRQSFDFVLPSDMAGVVSLGTPVSLPVLFCAAEAGPKKKVAKAPAPIAKVTAEGTDINKDLQDEFQPFFRNFSAYKPVYFLFGLDPGIESSSFQFSFQYKLFNFEENSFADRYLSGLEHLRLAYTQQSFWDLKSDSAPFEDSRYMPELFYESSGDMLDLPWLEASGFRAGFQHESNGRGGQLSRSTNYAYIQPFFTFKFGPRLFWKFSPKFWVYVLNEDESNGDLDGYRGYVDIANKIGDPEGFVLENHVRQGRKGGTWQFDLSYPLNRIPFFSGFLDMYIHAQYVTGYANQLLVYDRREDIIRLGFSLVR